MTAACFSTLVAVATSVVWAALFLALVFVLRFLLALPLGIAIGAFIWAVKSGQFEDLQGPAHRILMDDDDPLIPKNLRQSESSKSETDSHSQKANNSDEKASKL